MASDDFEDDQNDFDSDIETGIDTGLDDDNHEFDGDEPGLDAEDKLDTEETPKERSAREHRETAQQRINKVIAERNIERDARLRLERENAELRQQQQEREHEYDKSTLEQLREKKLEALALDDFQAIVDIDEKIMELKARPTTTYVTGPATPPAADTGNEPEPPYIPEAMDAWQQKNAWIFEDNNPRTVKAKRLYNKLLDDGFDPEDTDTFAELDKQLKRQIPPPSNSPDRGQATPTGTIQFTNEDKKLMIEVGMNPNEPDHRKRWLQSKKEVANG
jgi:hypothetical protein